MPAQTSVSCAVERRLRSLMTINAADLRHAAVNLARRPDATAELLADLKYAQRNRDTLRTEASRHIASCDKCFESGGAL